MRTGNGMPQGYNSEDYIKTIAVITENETLIKKQNKALSIGYIINKVMDVINNCIVRKVSTMNFIRHLRGSIG